MNAVVNLIEMLNKNIENAEKEEEIILKLVYTRYALDALFDMWVYLGNPLAYLAFHAIIPVYNLLVEVLRRKSFAEDLTKYAERLIKALRETSSAITLENGAEARLVKIVKEHLLPLQRELLTLRNASLLAQ